MLFGYPIAATAENWLHECLCAMVQMIHANHDAGQAVPTWPDIIPTVYRVTLRTRTGLRRLLNQFPFGNTDGRTPDWQIDFDPNPVECTTWDDVFHVRERIKRDVLDASFWQWLRDFSAWFKQRMGIADPGDAAVLDAMRIYAEDMALTGLTARAFLRAPVFQMLHRHCEAGEQRVLAMMKDVVEMAVPPTAAGSAV